jgi:hypothetical protein
MGTTAGDDGTIKKQSITMKITDVACALARCGELQFTVWHSYTAG